MHWTPIRSIVQYTFFGSGSNRFPKHKFCLETYRNCASERPGVWLLVICIAQFIDTNLFRDGALGVRLRGLDFWSVSILYCLRRRPWSLTPGAWLSGLILFTVQIQCLWVWLRDIEFLFRSVTELCRCKDRNPEIWLCSLFSLFQLYRGCPAIFTHVHVAWGDRASHQPNLLDEALSITLGNCYAVKIKIFT